MEGGVKVRAVYGRESVDAIQWRDPGDDRLGATARARPVCEAGRAGLTAKDPLVCLGGLWVDGTDVEGTTHMALHPAAFSPDSTLASLTSGATSPCAGLTTLASDSACPCHAGRATSTSGATDPSGAGLAAGASGAGFAPSVLRGVYATIRLTASAPSGARASGATSATESCVPSDWRDWVRAAAVYREGAE